MRPSTLNSTNPIRVLQLGSPTGLYGAERWILALVKHLDPQKVESVVAVIKDEPHLEVPLCQQAQKIGIRTHIFEAHGKINFSVIKQIRKFLISEKIDILHTHFYKSDIIGFLATRGTRCKIISTPHGWTQKPDLKLLTYEIADRMIFPFFHRVVPLSEKMFAELRKIHISRDKLRLIKNGVDVDEVVSENKIAEELDIWKKNGNFIIGYIGRLVAGKGLDILFYAIKQLHSVKWKLAIVGEGEEEGALRRLAQELNIADKLKFFGFQADRLSYLKGFDVFVLPSRSEGTPRSIMEAMAANIPVIASDIPGCRSLVIDKKTGLLFSLNSSADLAEKILVMLNDKEICRECRKNAYELINERFSAKNMSDEYQKIYQEILI